MTSQSLVARGRSPGVAQRIRDVRKRDFLLALQRTSHVGKAAEAAGIGYASAYEWRNCDPEFFAGWMEALEVGYQQLEIELLDRARHGVEEEVFGNGKHLGTVRRYDNNLALQLLAHHRETVTMVRALEQHAEPGEDVREKLAEKLIEMHLRIRQRAVGVEQGGATPDA